MSSVFVVQHLHRLPDGTDDAKFIGVYKSRDSAEAAVKRLKTQPGFSEFPIIIDFETDDNDQGFHVEEYQLDQDHWAEGFISI
jgi:hypothetical protein